MRRVLLACLCLWSCLFVSAATPQPKKGLDLPNPIVFVAQVPIPNDFVTIGATFGHHRATMSLVGRGGDLYIRYTDGSVRNLTRAAGLGNNGLQGAAAINVRDPIVHWDGQKVLFSMVVGAPEQFRYNDYYWQLYEITGLGPNDTPVVTKLPNQPETYNNIQPCYAPDDSIIFVSDQPRDGSRHHYPVRDEYESTPTPTGLWKLDPVSGNVHILNHAPSGAFNPIIDSDGRVIFSRWDHLQRDQQADGGVANQVPTTQGTFNYADESAQAARLPNRDELFPEPRAARSDLLQGTNLVGHSFNRFFVWQINTDGTGEEVINHIGRHEMISYFAQVFNDDGGIFEFISAVSGRFNERPIRNLFRPREDPTRPGTFYAIDAPEFGTHAAGQVVMFQGAAGANPDQMPFNYVTHRDTANTADQPSNNHSGLYRDVLVLSDGQVLAVHTPETRGDTNLGSRANPLSRYDFRIKLLQPAGEHQTAGAAITNGINETLSYYDPDVLVSYSGALWEMSPVELVASTRPTPHTDPVPEVERGVITQASVNMEALQQWMVERDLALVVSRNVTTRDANDRQQPFNLRVADTNTQTLGDDGQIYDVRYLQFFQADHVRGVGGTEDPAPGRRAIAQFMREPEEPANPPGATNPPGSVLLGNDGSMAAFVPARRALSWQLTDPQGVPVVRERFWLTFQPGEIRVCASCHGVNTADQAGNPEPVNEPEALRTLLQYWKSNQACVADQRDRDQNLSVNVLDAALLVNAVRDNDTSHDQNCDAVVNNDDVRRWCAGWLSL
ncbi:HzsA-related protein [Acanthopleuribacter pedis]|uniref:Hydrazine synthase alpha subunit middle domain-containing protein n=1 Tax=Acanthopleuribacter pedis TaxID=442870 RepID=A0A8J7U0W1_9BACT|nr:hypothetical protein [Acanthopleuribacter pedis]MBO1317508.1 hypothetical protein [Acanthopleuribacter pedis]